MDQNVLLSVKDLKTYFYTDNRCNRAVDGVSFQIRKGKTLGVVGESGCGKSVTAMSVMQLLPKLARIEEGEVEFDSSHGPVMLNKLEQNGRRMRAIRGGDIAMIFQDPMTSLNPAYRVGYQITESLIYHKVVENKEKRRKAIEMLDKMGIALPEQRIDEYPHQFSGGMRQRVMIAMAMIREPKLLIADEPTTALDVTIQAQILELMGKMQEEFGTSIMLITHDMGVIAEMADDVAVMYMGKVVESGDIEQILERPKHPYTQALLKSIPVLGLGGRQEITPIRGTTPDPHHLPAGCRFAPRCDFCMDRCKQQQPDSYGVEPGHFASCWLYSEVKE